MCGSCLPQMCSSSPWISPGAFERIVVHSFAEPVPVDVGRVEAGGGEHVGIHRRAEREMAADADAHHAEPARAGFMRLQVIERRARVGVVRRKFLA